MGTISSAHLRNSTDLIERIRHVDLAGKKMASFDVKALFTNVPVVGAMKAVQKVIESVSESELPVNKTDYIKLVSLCVKFGCFTFGEEEFVQHRGLAMGSPLSAVMASLYMELLESESLVRVMGSESLWFRYVDDIIVIMPTDTNVNDKLCKLNEVNEHIQFTVEEEVNGVLPFLDTVIHRKNERAIFSVYRKPTNKDDFVHFFSRHDMKTKSGIVIGFFLRAFRVCSDEFLHDECAYIVEAFKRTGLRIIHCAGKKTKDIVTNNPPRAENEDSVIYKIPCSGCSSSYIGETGRGLKKRIYEHKNDMRHHRTSNSLVVHARDKGHLPNWVGATTLRKGLKKRDRKTVEAAYITTEEETTNHREGFVCLSRAAAQLTISATGRPPGRDQSAHSTFQRTAT
ncbi:uncharacterized protein LOC123519735 [Portunus trituberculatus]|uniref:uncharacterized protein LOC123519735 n=1 Tax=Portunus trituberculatus TaxID=210409 RepID=UPI001E1CD491|nr:uncharacterized protein LOC123519735 [Portunus trituberculatus]